MTQSEILFTASIVLGSILIVGQIVLSVITAIIAPKKSTTEGLAEAGVDPDKVFDLLKSLATSAPLLVGGVILYGIAALASGAIAFAATATTGG